MEGKKEVSSQQVVRAIEKGFKKCVKPFWQQIDKRTVRIGSNIRIIHL